MKLNNKGFSILGLVIAGSIGSIITLGMATSLIDLSKGQKELSVHNQIAWAKVHAQARIKNADRSTYNTFSLCYDLITIGDPENNIDPIELPSGYVWAKNLVKKQAKVIKVGTESDHNNAIGEAFKVGEICEGTEAPECDESEEDDRGLCPEEEEKCFYYPLSTPHKKTEIEIDDSFGYNSAGWFYALEKKYGKNIGFKAVCRCKENNKFELDMTYKVPDSSSRDSWIHETIKTKKASDICKRYKTLDLINYINLQHSISECTNGDISLGTPDTKDPNCNKEVQMGVCSNGRWKKAIHCLEDRPCVAKNFRISLNGGRVSGCRKGRVAGSGSIRLSTLELETGLNRFYLRAYASVRKQGACGYFYIPFEITCREDKTVDKTGFTLGASGTGTISRSNPNGGFVRDIPRIGGFHSIKLFRGSVAADAPPPTPPPDSSDSCGSGNRMCTGGEWQGQCSQGNFCGGSAGGGK